MEPESTFKKAAFGDPRTDAQIRVAKRINTVALIGLIILLGSTFFYFVRLKNTKVALQDSKTEVEVQKDSLAKLQRSGLFTDLVCTDSHPRAAELAQATAPPRLEVAAIGHLFLPYL